ncbi:chromate transporter [Humitalea sp. 24SJ18S-53]|uniref:chromate transporter n=1 Tax=Humitalea sp. 24SJ18S-53 TaxID=3422307 RepID=UPI003D673E81
MTEPSTLGLFFFFARLSLLAVGGANAAVPEMHRRMVDDLGWVTDAEFSNAYALANAAPGPNVLVVALLGWRLVGVPGMFGALFGMLLPAMLVAWVAAGWTLRLAGHPWLVAIRAGLVPVAMGLSLATGIVMTSASAVAWPSYAVTAATAVFVWRSHASPAWALLVAGIAGVWLF